MTNKNNAFLAWVIFFLCINEIPAQGFWNKIESPVTADLRNIFFSDSLNGWAAGDSGVLIKTTDGGNSWEKQITNIENTIWSIHFYDNSLGWFVSWLDNSVYNGTIISKTTNGGIDWETIEFPQTLTYIEDIYFIDSLNGFAGVNYSPVRGPIYFTTDGGFTWALASILPDTLNYPFLPIKKFYSSEQNLFACGGAVDIAGVIWKSKDKGLTWRADSTVAPDPINELYFFDSLNIIGIGGDRELFYGVGIVETATGGEFWEYREIEVLGVAGSMDFRTPAEGWASLGSQLTFIFTSDSGKSWNEIPSPGSYEINDIEFTDTSTGFAVGNDGVIFKYEYITNTFGDNFSKTLESFHLHQNYPNPFNPETKLSFVISHSSFVSLKIYDVLGNEIAVLVNEKKSPGEYETKFDASGLSSGIYYYKLTAGNYSSVKKMILLK